MKRKCRRRARAASEHRREEFESCQQGIAASALRRGAGTQKPGAQSSELDAHFAPQPIESFQGKGEIFSSRPERKPGQQCLNERPKHSCRYGMPGKDIGQKNGKRLPAATALVAVGTEDTLSAFHSARRAERTVAIENAMADERPKAGTVRTRHLLERKSRAAKAEISCTKRIGEANISHCCRLPVFLPSRNFDGTARKRGSGKRRFAKTDGTGGSGTMPTLRS